MIKGETMNKIVMDMIKAVGSVVVSFLPTRLFAASEINTVTTPDILFSHVASNMPTKEALDFKKNTIFSLHSVTSVMAEMMHNFMVVLGFIVLLASLFQFFRYRENPAATRFAQVATTFFCGVFLIGVSYIASTVSML